MAVAIYLPITLYCSPRLHPFHGRTGSNPIVFLSSCSTSVLWSKKCVPSSMWAALQAPSSSEVEEEEKKPQILVDTLLSLTKGTDRGSLLNQDQHAKVLDAVSMLEQYCLPHPLQSPLIFGDWDVEYSSNPTATGGYYRSSIGRLLLKTHEMSQKIMSPDNVLNKVAFAALGFVPGEVTLKGKLRALDDKWIQVTFDPPKVKLGFLEFVYGGSSDVKIAITYLDERIRLGRGSRGSIFIFKRK